MDNSFAMIAAALVVLTVHVLTQAQEKGGLDYWHYSGEIDSRSPSYMKSLRMNDHPRPK